MPLPELLECLTGPGLQPTLNVSSLSDAKLGEMLLLLQQQLLL